MIETLIGGLVIIVLTSLLIYFDWHSYGDKIKQESYERNTRRLGGNRIRKGLDTQSDLRDASRAKHPAGKGRLPVRPRTEHERED